MDSSPRQLLLRGTTNIIVKEDLEQKLASGAKLNIKFGIDPTGSRLHIGRAGTMRRLKYFQQLGHNIQIVIGTFTGQIGDTSDKESERRVLSAHEVLDNMTHYKEYFAKILDITQVKFYQNGDWFNKMNLSEFMGLQQLFSINQMIERDNFQKRIKAGKRVGLHECSYALLQGYDSVAMESDVEIGGNDQLFNVLAGRVVQRAYSMEPQNIITYELINGTDGRKMSTSWGNCIWIDDPAAQMYGKVMSARDEVMLEYFRNATEVSDHELQQIETQIKTGRALRDLKARLAFEITKLYHNEAAAQLAAEQFERQFRQGELPVEIPVVQLEQKEWDIAELLIASGLVESKSEARRIFVQGGVRLNQEKVKTPQVTVRSGDVLQAGKRRFAKIK